MNKIFALVQNRIRKYTSRKLKFTIHPLQKEHLGSKYGGWVIPCNYLTNKSVCYFAGAGEDISFDVAVAGKYGSEIHIFDPTPRAKRHFQKLVTGTTNGEKVFYNHKEAYSTTVDGLRRIRFHDIGLWDKEEELKFFEPKDPEHVSHSALNIQKTKNYFIAKVKPLKTIMRELGHTKLDILKIDIEGAEYKVIDSIINDQIDLNVLCVEFDEVYNSLDDQYLDRIEKYINKLLDAGFRLIDIDKYYNSTFVKHQ